MYCDDPDAREVEPSEKGRRRLWAYGQYWDSISGYWLSARKNDICKKARRQLGEYVWLKSGKIIEKDEFGRPFELHHINGDKRDNRLSNIVYLSIENHVKFKGQRNKEVRIRQISTGREFESIKSACKEFGRYEIQSHLSGDYVKVDWERA